MLKKLISSLIMIATIAMSINVFAEDISKVDNGMYEFSLTCMKDKQDELSMAGTYVEPKGTLTKDEKGNHVSVKFMRSDWMKKIQIEIDGKDVPHEEEPGEGTEFFVKFDVPNGEPKIRVKLYVVPMNADVAFRIVPNYDYKKISDDTSSQNQNPQSTSENQESSQSTNSNEENKTLTESNKPKLPQTGSNINLLNILSVSGVLIGIAIITRKLR